MVKESYTDIVFKWVKNNPRCRSRQIAEGTGMTVHRVSNAVRTLTKKGVVISLRCKGVSVYEVADNIKFGRSKILSEFNKMVGHVRM